MRTAFINGKIFNGQAFLPENTSIVINDEIVEQIAPTFDVKDVDKVVDLEGNILAPGFFDIQVNGGGGVLFNDTPDVATIQKIGKAHREFGTCGFLPTLISDDLDVVKQAITAVDQAILDGVPGVLGIHIEGPFLSTDRKGVHNPEKFLNLEEQHLELLSSLKHGKTLVTLAPENTTLDIVRKLADLGVTLSAGHTNAKYEDMKKALTAGVTGFTHLFNAMSPFVNREPGVVGAALEDQDSWCGIIVDGHHVSDTAFKIAMKCKPHEKFMLVTDAMPTVGSASNTFNLQSKTIHVLDGACVDENGTLAGSALDMAQAVKNTVRKLDIPLPDALQMASLNPAKFMGLDKAIGTIAVGRPANLVVLNSDFSATQSWINGNQ